MPERVPLGSYRRERSGSAAHIYDDLLRLTQPQGGADALALYGFLPLAFPCTLRIHPPDLPVVFPPFSQKWTLCWWMWW